MLEASHGPEKLTWWVSERERREDGLREREVLLFVEDYLMCRRTTHGRDFCIFNFTAYDKHIPSIQSRFHIVLQPHFQPNQASLFFSPFPFLFSLPSLSSLPVSFPASALSPSAFFSFRLDKCARTA